MGIIEQAGEEFDALVNFALTGSDLREYETSIGTDLITLLGAVVSIKIVYMTQRAAQIKKEPQIGADSFMPSVEE